MNGYCLVLPLLQVHRERGCLRCKTVDPVGPHLVPQFIVRRTKFMGRGTSFPIRSPCHFRLSPESGGKAELASDKMLKLVDSKFLITDDAFH
jgi:hypothetical protein